MSKTRMITVIIIFAVLLIYFTACHASETVGPAAVPERPPALLLFLNRRRTARLRHLLNPCLSQKSSAMLSCRNQRSQSAMQRI